MAYTAPLPDGPLPEALRSSVLRLLGDFKLFEKAWPKEMIIELMKLSNEVYTYNDQLGKRFSVLFLALMPPMPDEDMPEGINEDTLAKVALGMIEGILRDL